MPNQYGLPAFSAPTYPGGLEPYVPMPVHLDLSNLLKYSALQAKAERQPKGSTATKEKEEKLDALSGEGQYNYAQRQKAMSLMTGALSKYTDNKELALNDPDYIRGNNMLNEATNPAALNELKRNRELFDNISKNWSEGTGEGSGSLLSYPAFTGALTPEVAGRLIYNSELLSRAEQAANPRAFIDEQMLTDDMMTPANLENNLRTELSKAGTDIDADAAANYFSRALVPQTESDISLGVETIDGVTGLKKVTRSTAGHQFKSNYKGLGAIGDQIMGSQGNLLRNVYFTEFAQNTQDGAYGNSKNKEAWKRGAAGAYVDKDGKPTKEFSADFGAFVRDKVKGLIEGAKQSDAGMVGKSGVSVQFNPLEAYQQQKYDIEQEMLNMSLGGKPVLFTTNERIEAPVVGDAVSVGSNFIQLMGKSQNPFVKNTYALLTQNLNEDGTPNYNALNTVGEVITNLGPREQTQLRMQLSAHGLSENSTVGELLSYMKSGDNATMLGITDIVKEVQYSEFPNFQKSLNTSYGELKGLSSVKSVYNPNEPAVLLKDWVHSNAYGLTNTGDFVDISGLLGNAEIVKINGHGLMEVPNTGWHFEAVGSDVVPVRNKAGGNYVKNNGQNNLVELDASGKALKATDWAVSEYIRTYTEAQGGGILDPQTMERVRRKANQDIVIEASKNNEMLPQQHTFSVRVAIPAQDAAKAMDFMVSVPNVPNKVEATKPSERIARQKVETLIKNAKENNQDLSWLTRDKNTPTGGLSADEYLGRLPVSPTLPGVKTQEPAFVNGKPNEVLNAKFENGCWVFDMDLSTGQLMNYDSKMGYTAQQNGIKEASRTASAQSTNRMAGVQQKKH